MANYVGGDRVIVNTMQVTATANLVDKTFVDIGGGVPANSAKCTGGVVKGDTLSGDFATLKHGVGSQLEVIATGAVTAGAFVEILTSTFTTKDTTGVTGAGVKDATSTNVFVGRALTGGSTNDTVLIELMHGVNV